MSNQRILILDIDGLRPDVFAASLNDPGQPALKALLGAPDRMVSVEALSTAPSITFCAQSSMFTGRSPAEHGIIGNQFFDRFGRLEDRGPKFYAFDVGDLLAVEDALRIYSNADGLLGRLYPAGVTTLHEHVATRGKRSATVHHMVGRGAEVWLKPDLVQIARMTKGGGLFGLAQGQFDSEMVDKAIALLNGGARPDVLTLYFLGLDQHSHHSGPAEQLAYMRAQIQPALARLVKALTDLGLLADLLVVVASDHGQKPVPDDARHSLRLSFPFERELAHIFDVLGLDVHDYPGETPDCDAVVASNGGLAYVYLRRPAHPWAEPPRFEADVLRVAEAFWAAHLTGAHSPELKGAFKAILVRDVEHGGWAAPFSALDPQGNRQLLDVAFAAEEGRTVIHAAHRLRASEADLSPDVILVANDLEGFYFSAPLLGVHGGLHPEESLATLAFGIGQVSEPERAAVVLAAVREALITRAAAERRPIGIADLTRAVLAALDA